MRASYKINEKITIQVEAETQVKLFEALADHDSIFIHGRKCGHCGSEDIVMQVRRPQTYVYFSFECSACHHELDLGQTQEGGRLFAKLNDPHGHPLDNNGWCPPYQPSGQDRREESRPQNATDAATAAVSGGSRRDDIDENDIDF